MRVAGIPVAELTAADLDSLVAAAAAEDYNLEFKQTLPKGIEIPPGTATKEANRLRDEANAEFRRDVAAFANSRGGAIVYGMADRDKGVASKVVGLPGIVAGQAKIELENLLGAGIHPTIKGYEIHVVACGEEEAVVIGIPRSVAAPHAVVGPDRVCEFWGRGSAGKYPMDVDQIRRAMLGIVLREQEAEDFRVGRIRRIKTEHGIPRLANPGPFCVLHVLPLEHDERIDLEAIEPDWKKKLVPRVGISQLRARPNVDGWIVSQELTNGIAHIQVFRSGGGIEVRADLGLFLAAATTGTESATLRGPRFELWISQWAKKAFEWFAKAAVQPPYAVMLSLIHVYGLHLWNDTPSDGIFLTHADYPIDVSEVLVPMQLLEGLPADISLAMSSSFDVVWQAASWARSPLFNNGVATYAADVIAAHW